MKKIESYIPNFEVLLLKVNPTTVSENAYAISYLTDLISHCKHYLKIYSVVLEKALENKNVANTALLDFGTGNGLLAIFAKFCGVKYVFASDVNSDFIEAAKKLSHQLNIEIDGWIIGNENALIDYFADTKIDVVVGTDVIEHIYNLDHFFKVLLQLNSSIISVFTTASVAENFFKSRKLKQLQIKDELEDSNAFQASYNNEFAGQSFLEIRKKIIAAYHPALAENEIEKLAIATRGLIKNDIELVVNNYLVNHKIPNTILHATNTCDPITGSWTERLLTVNEYRKIYLASNMQLSVFNGFYNVCEGATLSKAVKTILNFYLKKFPSWGIKLSPIIFLVGKK